MAIAWNITAMPANLNTNSMGAVLEGTITSGLLQGDGVVPNHSGLGADVFHARSAWARSQASGAQ
ncbi:hypothetical protein QJ054_31650 [Streptomyces sp. AN-3]|uniref:hypothetical protein n=1 Tax=Streptomyces sp. AN-3 TaxID=3044177 RepID=UPI00249AB705|nr:hypothetical protein [Streptomyces sp. AN-3]MDI3101605.1 hypothetical protein [Streptomyces sp. AN-3]